MSRPLAAIERFLSQAGFDRGPWLTVAFAGGIVTWFALPSPPFWVGFCGLCVVFATTGMAPWPGREAYPRLRKAALVLPLLAMAGCLTIWTRSEIVGEVPLERPFAGSFTARVLDIQPQPALGRDRLILAMREPDGGRSIKIRLNVTRTDAAAPVGIGDIVRFRGRLMPPAPPMLPGAYNFARTAWFSGIAGSGSALGEVQVVRQGEPGGGRLSGLRRALSDHIRERIGEERAGIASALVTGDRGGITEADDEAMRDSGLAHLLSVSGLHVSAVVGAIYVLVVRVLALFPWLALRVRLPMVAAAVGALAGVAYTLISGSEVPTVRSCIGALLVLVALALGREPLSLRMLAVAAFCVMLLWPEAVTGPSFQMSFGAVLALVALTTAGPVRAFVAPRDELLAARALRHLAMLLLTGIVIDLVLMPIGLFHFHRAGIYGALANVLAIPLTTFVVMPLLAGALVLDVLGAGWPLWWLAQSAIDLLTGLAHWFASRPGAVAILPAGANGAFLVFVAGGLWIGLWSGRVRWIGLPPALLGAGLLAVASPPDILVSGDGRHVGLVEAGGQRLFVLRDGGEGYARDNLRELAGMEGDPVPLNRWPGAHCNRDFCALPLKREGGTWRLLVSRGRDAVPERALAAACDRSDIVISDRWLPGSCRPRWFKADRGLLNRTGGLAVHLSERRLATVADGEGEHGWWRPSEPGPATIPDPPR
ncbi:ComEC/Rec2 family competence protein [Novosphingobium sp. BL-52-GroH]|uniref:ComEC/Rec2 family competence protein n=1 Tax=Novosphingobium sp. BL-52-GroH TaxID=3349877 RepID=UPI00384B9F26